MKTSEDESATKVYREKCPSCEHPLREHNILIPSDAAIARGAHLGVLAALRDPIFADETRDMAGAIALGFEQGTVIGWIACGSCQCLTGGLTP